MKMLKVEYRIVSAIILVTILTTQASSVKFGDSRLVYEWPSVELDWPSEEVRDEYIRNGSFVPERNLIAGIKIYQGDVYLTIPRWRWNSGQPATLVKVVHRGDQPKLRPYPDWQSQALGDCRALQYVQSMEIDPNTGLMYVLDTGRTGIAGNVTPNNLCPAKVVVYDLRNDSIVDTYEFPASVVSRTNNFMNDIVLDYVDNRVRFAYITDVAEGKLYSVDFKTRTSYAFEDTSMKPEGENGTIITVNGNSYTFTAGVDGIAMSYDFQYVYFTPLGGYSVYQIPTATLRNLVNASVKAVDDIRLVGRKVSQSDGMAHSNKRLYYGTMGLNAVYFWDKQVDERNQGVKSEQARMKTQTRIVGNDQTMQWIDTFAFDDQGWLWFLSNRLHLFTTGTMDFSGSNGANMRVWKVFIGEPGYLDGANTRTGHDGNVAARCTCVTSAVIALGQILSILLMKFFK